MAQYTKTIYTCDNCGKKLRTFKNNMEIVTELPECGNSWSRLSVQIKERHGIHNSGEENDAELCQKCAIAILTDALKRVKKGERLTAGVENSEESGWEK